MYRHVSALPARPAALLGAAALVVGSALTAGPAYAAPADGHSGATGKATAVAASADLNVSVKDVGDVPVKKSLGDVSAPEDTEQTLLTAKVNGLDQGQPVTLVKADVAQSSAQTNAQRSVGDVKLVGVRAYAPGLPAKPLLSADILKATATCETGKKPTAKPTLADNVAVLGKPVSVNGPGSQNVEVPGIGTVDLALEQATTTDSTAAATALRLKYAVKPNQLGVAKTSGEIVLAEATCAMPDSSGAASGGSEGGTTGGGATEGGTTEGQSSGGSAGSNGAEGDDSAGSSQPDDGANLAETGGSSATPIIAGVGATLLLAGGGAMYLIRRRGTAQGS